MSIRLGLVVFRACARDSMSNTQTHKHGPRYDKTSVALGYMLLATAAMRHNKRLTTQHNITWWNCEVV